MSQQDPRRPLITTGAAKRRRDQAQRSQAKHAAWLSSCVQVACSHHTGTPIAAMMSEVASLRKELAAMKVALSVTLGKDFLRQGHSASPGKRLGADAQANVVHAEPAIGSGSGVTRGDGPPLRSDAHCVVHAGIGEALRASVARCESAIYVASDTGAPDQHADVDMTDSAAGEHVGAVERHVTGISELGELIDTLKDRQLTSILQLQDHGASQQLQVAAKDYLMWLTHEGQGLAMRMAVTSTQPIPNHFHVCLT